MFRQFRQTIGLASHDFLHEWQMSICFILALAAVLGPMMILFGLKFGIVGSMVDSLIEEPAKREIRPVGSSRYDSAWIDEIRAREDVDFIVPRTRNIAASIQLKSSNSSSIISVEVIPTDKGDPLLPKSTPVPADLERILLSNNAAQKLNVGAGDIVDGSLVRQFNNQKERVHLALTVAGVAPSSAFSRDGMFASVTMVEALEDFRDGHAVPATGWSGTDPIAERDYTGFRLYAKSIYDVAGLRDSFERSGINVVTQAADIESVQRMDKTLSGIYWAIALIGVVGFSLSLGASLWANVDRKRKELSVMRLIGFRTGDIVWFPVVQSFYTALFGWALACGIYYAAAWSINRMLAPQLEAGQDVCKLLPEHYLMALGLTMAAAVISAMFAGMRSARIEASDGLREI
jgi:putative ABC transport system permease protein